VSADDFRSAEAARDEARAAAEVHARAAVRAADLVAVLAETLDLDTDLLRRDAPAAVRKAVGALVAERDDALARLARVRELLSEHDRG
jgi:hypothetical protein